MTVSEVLVSALLSRLDRIEQCATAAGHGFGHLPLTHELNGGWTQLDLTDNVRPSYDVNFARSLGPDEVLRLCRAHRDLIELHARPHECGEVKTGVYPPDWPTDAPYGAPGEPWRHVSSEYFEDEPCPSLRALARGLGVEEEIPHV